MKKILVIAGNINQYYEWLRENQIKIDDYSTKYVHRAEQNNYMVCVIILLFLLVLVVIIL